MLKNIIFDLGGVIINLDTQLTIDAFAKLTARSHQEVLKFVAEEEGFRAYEKGQITDDQFRTIIKQFSDKDISDHEIDEAWNAMILDFPAERIEELKLLASRYRIFLMSNTNYIHMRRVNEVRVATQLPTFDTIFEHDYYSHLIGMRKPDAEIFEYVLNQHDLKADETLFIDDNESNIDGAKAVGLQTLHVTSPEQWMDYFKQ